MWALFLLPPNSLGFSRVPVKHLAVKSLVDWMSLPSLQVLPHFPPSKRVTLGYRGQRAHFKAREVNLKGMETMHGVLFQKFYQGPWEMQIVTYMFHQRHSTLPLCLRLWCHFQVIPGGGSTCCGRFTPPPFLILWRLPFEEQGAGSHQCLFCHYDRSRAPPPQHSAQGKCPSGSTLVTPLSFMIPCRKWCRLLQACFISSHVYLFSNVRLLGLFICQ